MPPSPEIPLPARPSRRGGVREVFELAYPVVLTQLSLTAMGIVDAAIVGRLGATELAAVGFAGIWLMTAFNLFFGTASGVQTFVSQEDGAGAKRRCGPWAWQALYFLVPTTLAVVVGLLVWIEPLLSLLGPSDEMQQACTTYVRPRLLGSVAMAFTFVLAGFFRGLGDTRTPLYAALVANGLNALLTWALVFGKLGLPALGVAGAGVGTAIGECVSGLYLIVAFRRQVLATRYATAPVWPRGSAIRRFVRTGAPIGGQWALSMLAFSVFSTVVAHMGDKSMAASQAFIVLLSVSFMQMVGISTAATTLVGRYIGERDLDAAYRSFASAQKLAGALAGVVALALVAAPELLLRAFTDDPEVLRLGTPLVIVGAAFQVIDAFGIVANGALRGAGDTRWPFLVQTAIGWLVFLPLAYFVGVTLGGGVVGAWAAGIFDVALLTGSLVWRFRSGAWEHIRI